MWLAQHELAPPLRKPKLDEEPYVADRFLQFLKQDLIPWTEAQYRTQPFRILVGHSLTGLFTLHTFLNSPDTFNAYLALSPALWWDDEALMQEAPGKLRALQPGQATRFLYLAAGHESVEITEPTGRWHGSWSKLSCPDGWRYDYLPEAKSHVESSAGHYRRVCRWCSPICKCRTQRCCRKGWPVSSRITPGCNESADSKLRPSHAMLSWMGSFLIQQGREKEAAPFFERAAQLYPNHPPLMRDWPARPLQ